jgi:hypothetical protein
MDFLILHNEFILDWYNIFYFLKIFRNLHSKLLIAISKLCEKLKLIEGDVMSALKFQNNNNNKTLGKK